MHQCRLRKIHIRRLENGLERPCGRSRPAPRHLASLVGTDAFAGALTRGNIGTIPETAETENTRSYQGGLWLMSQSATNWSRARNSLLAGILSSNSLCAAKYLSDITAYFELTFSTVESRTPTPLILVRIQVPQPNITFSRYNFLSAAFSSLRLVVRPGD
jgi:hypothetical protein